MFLAVSRIPAVPDAIALAATATGQVRADAQRRLAGVLPRVLLVDADRDVIKQAQTALAAAGFQPIAFDPLAAPSDDERLLARSFELGADELIVVTGVGAETRHHVPLDALFLLQRATRSSTSSRAVTTKERKIAVGTAILTGGLKVTKTVERTSTETSQAQETLLVLHRRDGGPDIVMSEQRFDYRFLGAALQPMSRANFDTTIARLRALAPRAAFDDRASRPGFVAGLPLCSADALDVALYLIQLEHAQGALS